MPTNRLDRDQFYRAMSSLDDAGLRKALWTVYYRGAASTRERIETEIGVRRAAPAKPAVDPDVMLVEVEDFVELALSGAYLGRSRRVSPQERTRWRFTLKRLVTEAHDALAAEDPTPAITALGRLIDLALATQTHDYFRSQDPIAAAGFVVSDAAAAMWGRLVDVSDFETFAETAAPQLLRWEQQHGWTRTGDNATAAKETALATVLSRMLRSADDWERFGAQYLRALDASASAPKHPDPFWAYEKRVRTASLAQWHDLLRDNLADFHPELLDRILTHDTWSG